MTSGADGKICAKDLFEAINLHFELFSLPFQIRNHVAKAYIFSNNEVNNLKVELKVSGRVRVGVGRDLLSQ